MNFTGIDAIVYGVEDLATCQRFLDDWGVTPTDRAPADGLAYETLDGSEIIVRPAGAVDLPPAFEAGSTLRRVIWGVPDQRALDAVRKAIAGQPGFAEEDGLPSVTDPNGMRLSFRVSRRRPVAVKGSPLNTYDRHDRVDERTPVYERAHPIRIGHVVFFTADIMETLAFYEGVLGFRVSDSYPRAGYFLRCKPEGGHHDLFLLQTPDAKRGLNHVAFTVRDIHEIFGGGIYVNQRGWQTQIGPGRHPISSAYFWYVHNPCGGLAEYYSNEDYCTENWQAKEWPRSAENFAEWAISGGIDAKTRRQPDRR
ncbi:MAG: VOC family protein [Azospirillaceae bacterium]